MKRVSFKHIYFVLVISTVFSSCSSFSTIPIEVMKPAGYSVDPSIVSVVVVNNTYPYRADSIHKLDLLGEKSYLDSTYFDSFGAEAARMLAKTLNERAFFDTVYYYPYPVNRPADSIPYPTLHADTLTKLIEKYQVQAVVSIESYRYNSSIKVEKLSDYYYVSQDVAGTAFWKVYDRHGRLLDAYLQRDSIFWDNTEPVSKVKITIPELSESLDALAGFMGERYTDRLAPHWDVEQRTLFVGGHYLFSRATDLAKVNSWNEAAKIWYYVYEHGNKKQKAMAAHNIALSYEMRNNFSEAMAWADVSRNLFDKPGAVSAAGMYKIQSQHYYLRLKEREDEKVKLESQLGPL
ncbi:DUF6340 family protein [Geofilum sp. OHC36d9]|uniref:DUF6340 family protein n=1 Tax=Geofilum sp. OHC36d9 TaxID=3458413 RepID=UPI0040333993